MNRNMGKGALILLSELIKPFKYPRSKGDEHKAKSSPRNKSQLNNRGGTLKRIWLYLAASWGKLLFVLLMVLLSSSLALLGPYLVGKAIDTYIVDRETQGIVFLLLLLAGIYLVHSLAIF